MTDDTIERDSYEKLARDMADTLNRMSQEHDLELCYSMAIDALDMHTTRSAALSAMPQQEVTVKDADIEKAVLVLLGKSKEHAPGVDYVASRTMKKSEWCDRMKAALRAISEGE